MTLPLAIRDLYKRAGEIILGKACKLLCFTPPSISPIWKALTLLSIVKTWPGETCSIWLWGRPTLPTSPPMTGRQMEWVAEVKAHLMAYHHSLSFRSGLSFHFLATWTFCDSINNIIIACTCLQSASDLLKIPTSLIHFFYGSFKLVLKLRSTVLISLSLSLLQ